MRIVDLEEERIPQLGRRRYSEVPTAVVATRLATATYIGSGSFCRVWKVTAWQYASSPANGRPVVSCRGAPLREAAGRASVAAARILSRHTHSSSAPALQVIKVCSAGFKELAEDDRRFKQQTLVRHWCVRAGFRTNARAPGCCPDLPLPQSSRDAPLLQHMPTAPRLVLLLLGCAGTAR